MFNTTNNSDTDTILSAPSTHFPSSQPNLTEKNLSLSRM
jgi:hypothetical protein